ncbi:MAG: hypothetical protein IJD42_02225 [Clostridia bacterium]|nr:hypothetical protein [Clostridia bacterium]
MKKALALMLAIIMLLSLLISCDDEQTSSSSESEAEPQISFPYIDGDGFPVFRNATDTYKYINVQAKEELPYNALDTILVSSYEDMHTFALQNLNQSSVNGIDETVFTDHFILAVYRDNNRKMKEYYCYSNLTPHKTINNYYQLDFEYVSYLDKGYTMEIAPNTFDLVVVPMPKTDEGINEVTSRSTIGIRQARHEYSLRISSSAPDNDIDLTLNKPKIIRDQYGTMDFKSINEQMQSIVVRTKFFDEPEGFEEFKNVFKKELIVDYDTFVSRLTAYTDNASHNIITAETFNNHYVYVTSGRYSSVGDLKKHDDYYMLDSEIVSGGYDWTDDIKPILITFILLPKEKIDTPEDFTLHFRSIVHYYQFVMDNAENNPF